MADQLTIKALQDIWSEIQAAIAKGRIRDAAGVLRRHFE